MDLVLTKKQSANSEYENLQSREEITQGKSPNSEFTNSK